jgi:hypothetical protein
MVSCFQFFGFPARSKAGLGLRFDTVSTRVRVLKCTCTLRLRLNALLLRVPAGTDDITALLESQM